MKMPPELGLRVFRVWSCCAGGRRVAEDDAGQGAGRAWTSWPAWGPG